MRARSASSCAIRWADILNRARGPVDQSVRLACRPVRASCFIGAELGQKADKDCVFGHAILPIAALARMLRHHRLLDDLRCSSLDEWFRLPIRGTSTPSTEPHQLTSQTQIATVAR